MQLYEFKETQERVILIGVQTGVGDDVEASLDELDELAQTAGAETVAKVIQNREAVHPGTYIGKGKIEEVASLLRALDANGVICDDELSPSQLNNLERELDCKVMDRTLLILDIFARRAVSSEGKIQVELAQLRYRAARLVGLRESLSRLGGGIGTRGPGEKKLETDRRLIRTRISALKAELSQVERHRELIRGKRSRGSLKTAAIVGYTNAGKSTASEYAHRCRNTGGGQAFCYIGSNYESTGTKGWTAAPAHGYSRIYTQAAASSGRSLQEYAGGGKVCRLYHTCSRCF